MRRWLLVGWLVACVQSANVGWYATTDHPKLPTLLLVAVAWVWCTGSAIRLTFRAVSS